jgi:hypothetical protein
MTDHVPPPPSPDDAIALLLRELPPALRRFLDRELAAGNGPVSAGRGFPAAPAGVWVKLHSAFRTDMAVLPPEVIHRKWVGGMWPEECRDDQRRCLVCAGKGDRRQQAAEALRRLTDEARGLRGRARTIARSVAAASPAERRLSAAIAQHRGALWNTDTEAKIRAMVGPEGLARIREIDDYANRPERWITGVHHENYAAVKVELAARWPFLSPEAIERVATRAAIGWR